MAIETAKMTGSTGGLIGDVRAPVPAMRRAPIGHSPSPIETNVSEVSLMWVLHQRALSEAKQDKPLHQLIAEFSGTVFRTILSGSPSIKHEHLWMIYFKGLIVSNTHAREMMVQAIHQVQAQNAATWRASVSGRATAATNGRARLEAVTSSAAAEHADTEALQQITTALGHTAPDASGR